MSDTQDPRNVWWWNKWVNGWMSFNSRIRNATQGDGSWQLWSRGCSPLSSVSPKGHYWQRWAEPAGVCGQQMAGGRQSPHLHDRQQELVAFPEEAQDDAFKIPATHRRQIPERACLITANGVDKTKQTQHSEYSAAQPEVALDSGGRPSMLPPHTSACRIECHVHVLSCVWPLPSVSVLFCSSLLLGITHSCPRAIAHTDSSPGNTNNFPLGHICFPSAPGSVATPDCLVPTP